MATTSSGSATAPGWRLELIRDAGTVTVELDPVFRARGAGVDLVHSGPPPVERSLACFVDAAALGDPSAVCCRVDDGVRTLAVALAAQDAALAAQSALDALSAAGAPAARQERRKARRRRPG